MWVFMVGLVMGLLSDFVLGGRFCRLWLVLCFLAVVWWFAFLGLVILAGLPG